MAKQIIVLNNSASDVGSFNVRVVFWVPVSPAYPNPQITSSAWKDASASEIQALQQGTVIEFVKSFNFANGTPVATMKSVLNSAYTAFVASMPSPAPFFGVFFDSVTAWSA